MQVNFAETGRKFYKLATAIPRLIGKMKDKKLLKMFHVSFVNANVVLRLKLHFHSCLFFQVTPVVCKFTKSDIQYWWYRLKIKVSKKVTKHKPPLRGEPYSIFDFGMHFWPKDLSISNWPYTWQFFNNWKIPWHSFALLWPPPCH